MVEPIGAILGALGVAGLLSVCLVCIVFIRDGLSNSVTFSFLKPAKSRKLISDAASQHFMSPEYPKKAPFKRFSLREDDWGVQLRPIRLLDVQANTQEYALMLAKLEVNWKRVRIEAKMFKEKFMSMRILNAETANPTATAIVTFEGPPQSPYRTGIFQLRVLYGPNYPRVPMEVTFLTKIYHPNVDHTGEICLGMLGKDWVPAWSTEKVVFCIMALLSDHCPEDALVPEIVSTYLHDRELYEQNAAMYTEKYATLDAALWRMAMACE